MRGGIPPGLAVYPGIAIIVLTALAMRYASLGITIQAAGIEPKPVEKPGLSAARIRYLAVLRRLHGGARRAVTMFLKN